MAGRVTGVWRRFRAWPLWAQVLVGLLILSVIVAPFIGEEDDDTEESVEAVAESTTSLEVQESSTTTSLPPSTTTTPAPTTTTKDEPSTTAATEDSPLRGFGMTCDEWEATHERAPGSNDGSAFRPLLSRGQPKYTAVPCDPNGFERVITYVMYMEPRTPMDVAQAMVAAEFPTDAIPGPLVDGGECFLQEWRSDAVEAVLEDPYVPEVAYSKDDPTIPREHDYRVVSFVITEPGDLGFC